MEEPERPKRKWETGLILGIIALLINIITVSVYINQTRIMRSQQHVAAWPYLEWRAIFNEDDGFSLNIRNNGLGPALIKSVRIKVDGKEFANMDSLFVQHLGTSYFPHLQSGVQNRVLPAGESVKRVEVTDIDWAWKLFELIQYHQFEYEICYESVYGDAWISKGLEVEEGKCK